jgi:drug/metabolite transporter (DMT)-like permease
VHCFILTLFQLWVYISTVLGRSVTNMYSSRLTSAIYVQLIALLSPFMVSGMTFLFLRHTPEGRADRLTIKTFLTLLCTIAGSLLIILGGIKSGATSDTTWWHFITNFNIDWKTLGSGITLWDGLGMGCALLSNMFLSAYMIMVKILKKANAQSASRFLTEGEGMFLFQTSATSVFFFGPSLILDNWTPWLMMQVKDWIMFACFVVLVMLLAMLLSIHSIQTLGATTVGATVSIRLVSTIVFSIIILGETMQSAWQLIGAIIVLVSVSLFLYLQNKQHKEFAKEEAKKLQEISPTTPEINLQSVIIEENTTESINKK